MASGTDSARFGGPGGKIFSIPGLGQAANVFVPVSLTVLFLFGVYSGVTIYTGNQPVVPSIISCCSAVIYFIIFRPLTSKRLLVTAIAAAAFLFVSLLVSAVSNGYFSVKGINGTLNILYSWMFCYALFCMATRHGVNSFRAALLIFWAFLAISALLDVLGPLRELSESFRRAVFPVKGLYSEDMRDILLYGGYRPRPFTSEPSFVGLWSTVAISAWYLTFPFRLISLRSGAFLAASSFMFYLERSPTILFGGLMFAGALFYNRLPSTLYKRGSLIAAIGYALSMIAVPLSLTALIEFTPRYGSTAFLHGESIYYRMTAPAQVAARVISSSPLIGIGVGVQERLSDETIPIFLDNHQESSVALAQRLSITTFIANSFFLHWIYFGLFGGVVALLMYDRVFRALGVSSTLAVFALTVPMWFTLGGYVTMQCWAIVAVIAGARVQLEALDTTLVRPRAN